MTVALVQTQEAARGLTMCDGVFIQADQIISSGKALSEKFNSEVQACLKAHRAAMEQLRKQSEETSKPVIVTPSAKPN
jgi:hypothetical protein